MKVKLRQIAAGPEGVHDAGDVVDLPQKDAVALVHAGQADAIDPMPAERADLAARGETTESKAAARAAAIEKPIPTLTAKP